MATIHINEDWRLASDKYCWMLQKKRTYKTGKKAGEVDWNSETFHTSISQALSSYKSRALRESDAETAKELLEVAKIIDKDVNLVLESFSEPV